MNFKTKSIFKVKKWFTLLFVAAVVMQAFAFKGDQKIRFREYSWTDMGRNAKAHNKMIFVLVTGNYCSTSRKMQRVLHDKNVAAFYNKNFVSTNFDAEDFVQHYRASNWGISSVPSVVYLDQDRKVVHKFEGYLDAHGLVREAQTAIEMKKK